MLKRRFPILAITALFLFSLICPLTASSAEPLDYEVGITKGLARLDAEKYAEAVVIFRDVLRSNPGDLKAQLMLGIALNRNEELDEAEKVLTSVAEKKYDLARTYYELGVVSYKRGNNTLADDYFRKAGQASPESSLKASIADFSSDIAGRKETRPYSLKAGVALQYDTNASVLPDEQDPIAKYNFDDVYDHKSDARTVFTLRGNLVVSTSPVRLTAGYSFYQSLHFRLSDFDVMQHVLDLKTAYSPMNNVVVGADYFFQYSFLSGDDYARVHTFRPYVRVTLHKEFPTKLVFGYAIMGYNNTELVEDNELRSGHNIMAGIEQSVNVIENLFLTFGYYYDNNNADEGVSSYSGNKYLVSAHYDHNGKWTAGAKFEYHDRNYRGETKYPWDWFWTGSQWVQGWKIVRNDEMKTFEAYFTKPLSSVFTLGLGEVYIINSSSEPSYDYKRSVTTISLTARF